MDIAKGTLLSLFFISWTASSQNALTFFPGTQRDRTGDRLMAYIRAKWIAYDRGLQFLLPPAPTWEGLVLAHAEIPCAEEELMNARRIRKSSQIQKTSRTRSSKLYRTDFNVDIDGIHSFDDLYLKIKERPDFAANLQAMIHPVAPIHKLDLPADMPTIAVHVRKGGGFDLPLRSETDEATAKGAYADLIWPTKFPPNEFYIQALDEICALLSGQEIYVHIFTDDPNPVRIKEIFQTALPNHPLIYGLREQGNRHDQNVHEDLFNMACFDYLIRSQSSYARVAQLIGNHQMIISPLAAEWKDNKLVITKISRVTRPNFFQTSQYPADHTQDYATH